MPSRETAMSKRDFLGYLSLGLAIVAALAVVWYYFFVPHTLRIGVAPAGSEAAQFLSAFSTALKREEAGVRIAVVPFATPEDVSAALDAKKLDLAAVRSDMVLPTSSLGVAVLHQFVVTTLARHEAGIEKFADLEGKTVVVLGPGEATAALFKLIAHYHGLAPGSVNVRKVVSSQALASPDTETFDAVFMAAPRGGRGPERVFHLLEERFGNLPAVVPLGEVGALLARNPTFAKAEIPPGEFSNTPVVPAKAVPTVTFPALIVARRQLASAPVQEFTKQLFSLRQALASQYPAGGRIAALPTSRGAPIAVHPGAAVYYDASETSFLEKYSDLTWLLLFGFSTIASLLTWIISLALPKKRELVLSERQDAIDLIDEARAATTISQLDDIEHRIDKLIVAVSDHVFKGSIDNEKLRPSFDLIFDRLATVIEEKRQALAKD